MTETRPRLILIFLLLALLIPGGRPVFAADDDVLPSTPAPESNLPDLSRLNIQGAPAPKNTLGAPMELLSKLPPQVQAQLLSEADMVRSYCSTNTTLANFYDCSCMSLRFMGDRIEKGPDVSMLNLIGGQNYADCVAQPNIAGYAYQRCFATLNMRPMTTEQLNATCECVARALTISFTAQPVANIVYIDSSFTNALVSCNTQRIQ